MQSCGLVNANDGWPACVIGTPAAIRSCTTTILLHQSIIIGFSGHQNQAVSCMEDATSSSRSELDHGAGRLAGDLRRGGR